MSYQIQRSRSKNETLKTKNNLIIYNTSLIKMFPVQKTSIGKEERRLVCDRRRTSFRRDLSYHGPIRVAGTLRVAKFCAIFPLLVFISLKLNRSIHIHVAEQTVLSKKSQDLERICTSKPLTNIIIEFTQVYYGIRE